MEKLSLLKGTELVVEPGYEPKQSAFKTNS